MRKIVTVFMIWCMLCFCAVVQAASVTDARWGLHANDALRVVAYVSDAVYYDVKLENQEIKLIVQADVENKIKGNWPVKSNIVKTMTVKKEGGKTIIQLPLTSPLTRDNYNSFVIRKDANNKVYRIILDISPKKASNQPVISNQPIKKPVNTGATWAPPTSNSSSSGSWTDRFHKNRDEQSNATKLSPMERVKQSIAEAKAKKQATAGTNTAPVNSVAKAPANNTVVVTKSSAATISDKPATINQGAAEPKKLSVAEQQSTLKKYLLAKQKARREAAAAEKKKNKNNSNKEQGKASSVVVKNGVTYSVIDGLTYIRGTGKYSLSGGIKGKVITIDAGHGGSDPGAIGTAGVQEKNITLPIAKKLQELLVKEGAKVYMTRTTDVDVYGPNASDRAELQARVNVAEKVSSDAFVSIHINSSVNKSIGGISCYYHPKTANDARLARCIQDKLTANFKMNDLGIREAGFYVMKRSSMPTTLLELAFISNKKEEAVINTGWYQQKAAQMIFEGLKKYFA